jgi:uncharacterized membrane protein (UPF0182 family)
MAVNSDATDQNGYGQIRALALPRSTSFLGPLQMQNKIESDQTVQNNLLALRKGGSSEVILGNLLTLPVADGLMYVEPVYARATAAGSYPTLRKVIVSFGDEVSIGDTYQEALGQFFTGVDTGNGGHNGGGNNGGHGNNHAKTAQHRLENALADASAAYERGQHALANGDFAAYGEAQKDLADALRRAEAAAAELGLKPSVVTPEPSSPETSPSPSPSPSAETSVTPARFP